MIPYFFFAKTRFSHIEIIFETIQKKDAKSHQQLFKIGAAGAQGPDIYYLLAGFLGAHFLVVLGSAKRRFEIENSFKLLAPNCRKDIFVCRPGGMRGAVGEVRRG